MDVERIQKINSMALELLKKGMASDREDAVKQAELFYKDLSGDTAALRIPGRESVSATGSVVVEKSASATQQAAGLSADKINEIMEKNSQFLVKTIKEFQEKIQALEGEVNSLKQKMLMNRPASSALAPGPASSGSGSGSSASAKPAAGSSSESHPRTGSYKQEEVSIEKYFYMGGKK